MKRASDEAGIAVVAALLIMVLLAALGTALTLLSVAEMRIAGNYRGGQEALYAADAAVALALAGLSSVPDWSLLSAGSVVSPFVDGTPGGVRETAAGRIDLTQATNVVRCGRVAACSDADLEAVTQDRPWGVSNPRWQLYVYGRLGELFAIDGLDSSVYVIAWVSARPNAGNGVLGVLAHAYGPGAQRAVEVTVERAEPSLRVLSWREVR